MGTRRARPMGSRAATSPKDTWVSKKVAFSEQITMSLS